MLYFVYNPHIEGWSPTPEFWFFWIQANDIKNRSILIFLSTQKSVEQNNMYVRYKRLKLVCRTCEAMLIYYRFYTGLYTVY